MRHNLGSLLAAQGKLSPAVRHLRESISLEPGFTPAHFNLGTALKEQGRKQEALAAFYHATKMAPGSLPFRLALAGTLAELGKSAEATREYQEAFKLDSRWPWEASRTAWALATHPKSAARNESRAVALAEQACQATNYEQPDLADTLGAAYAAAGRFDVAESTAQKALSLAEKKNRTELISAIRNRVTLYRDHKMFRDPDLH